MSEVKITALENGPLEVDGAYRCRHGDDAYDQIGACTIFLR
jgi:hypothetical protein